MMEETVKTQENRARARETKTDKQSKTKSKRTCSEA